MGIFVKNVSSLEIQNVIGYLKGSKETDRYVILSNHFDAWSYGSVSQTFDNFINTLLDGS